MANNSIKTLNLNNLDPNTYKESFKNFLKSQTVFKDYNFEDSNMDMLLTILGHNTYLNSFYKNMIYAESDLSKAQLRSSVVSKAKELNYLPQSRHSSIAEINITIEAQNINVLELPKGTQFSGRTGINSYVFTTDKNYIAKSSTGLFTFSNVMIFEGSYFSDTYIMNPNIENQEFIISNSDVDISSISVLVLENNGSDITEFKRVINTYNLTPNDNIFFIEGFQDTKYKIVFGDDVIGRKPTSESTIILTYRICTGVNNADYVNTFNLDEDIVNKNGGILNNIVIETINNSYGGGERESTESIKYNAPRFYAAQESAVTKTDYKSLIMDNFSSFIQDVSVYGGENASPKQYGKTIIAIKPKNNDITPTFIKENIKSFLEEYKVVAITPIISDADSFYILIDTIVEYTSSLTQLYRTDIEKEVIETIKTYSKENLEQFDEDFRYSNFCSAIDNSDSSITSNDTNIKLCKRIIPKNNVIQKIYIEFSNQISFSKDYDSLTSSKFSWINDETGIVTENCYLSDDKTGIINIYSLDDLNNPYIVEKKIGKINYTDGIINISKFFPNNFNGNYLEIIIKLENKNIIVGASKILYIDINDVNLDVRETIV